MGARRETGLTQRLLSLAMGLFAVFFAAPALAEARAVTLPPDPAFEARIAGALSAKDPEAAEMFRRANEAREGGDGAKAIELYAKVSERDPWFSHAERRQCGVEDQLGHYEAALRLCRHALSVEDSTENASALAATLAGHAQPGGSELTEAERLIVKAQQKSPRDPYVLTIRAGIALSKNDLASFRPAVQTLLEVAPHTVSTQFYAVLLAASEGRPDDAYASLEEAKRLGLDDQAYGQLKRLVHDSVPWPKRAGLFLAKAGAAWAVAFALLLAAGFLLSGLTLRAASRPPEAGAGEASGHVSSGEALLRRIYRSVLWVCCAYYYLSIPLLVLVVLGACGGVVFGMLALGYISIKLIVIALILGYGTVVAIGKSLFVRVKDQDPGARLDLAQHPRFSAVVNEVAERVGTRPVDTVFVTPFTEIAVFDKGSLLKNLRGTTERCLILGAGVLDGMDQRSFKSILAHEYGHFKNEDTAGGGFALAVRRSLLTMTVHMVQRGVATKINPAWWFVMGFWKLFLRISQGASRLQEVLADRWSAMTYGSREFEKGLRHVIERSVRFDAHLQATLDDVMPQRRALVNAYAYVPPTHRDDGDLSKKIEAQLDAEPSSYDSHPAPKDRIAWVRALAATGRPPTTDDASPVWDLFDSREGLERQMTDRIRELVSERRGVHLPSAETQAA